jgi:hypothetical protein
MKRERNPGFVEVTFKYDLHGAYEIRVLVASVPRNPLALLTGYALLRIFSLGGFNSEAR